MAWGETAGRVLHWQGLMHFQFPPGKLAITRATGAAFARWGSLRISQVTASSHARGEAPGMLCPYRLDTT